VRILASPAYLVRHGTPTTIEDLASHRLLGFTKPSSLNIWPLPQQDGGGLQIQPVLAASSGSTLLQLAVENAGIVCLADFLTSAAISSGRLVPVMESLTLPWTQPVWAVFYKQGALAPRVSVLLEFLAKKLAGKALQD
jgi:DNA-binding transcriptional LysR family regulator